MSQQISNRWKRNKLPRVLRSTRFTYQFTSPCWSKDHRTNGHLSNKSVYIFVDIHASFCLRKPCIHTYTRIFHHGNFTGTQLERMSGDSKKVSQRVVHTLFESQITGVWKHVWMVEKLRIRDRNAAESLYSLAARSDRFTGNVPAREDHKPLYSDVLRRLRPSNSISTFRRSILSLPLERLP